VAAINNTAIMHIVASRLFMEAHPSRALCRRWALLLFVFLPTNYHLRVYRGNCPINRPSLSTVKRDGIDRTSRVGIASLYWYGGQRRPSPDRSYRNVTFGLMGQIPAFR
jgi:hypothetical protein